ncbi:MAG: hypothetical protein M3Y58_23590 [Chloroflexota bacterium]|nr:hypothetical protein [Chloroflexota bacterium]
MNVCHNCPGGDNRRCVNPAHLFTGTAADNVADMIAKGNFRRSFARPTHCPHGHEYTPENTYVAPSGSRMCRICRRTRFQIGTI